MIPQFSPEVAIQHRLGKNNFTTFLILTILSKANFFWTKKQRRKTLFFKGNQHDGKSFYFLGEDTEEWSKYHVLNYFIFLELQI